MIHLIHSFGTTVRSAAYLFGVEGETGEFAFETRDVIFARHRSTFGVRRSFVSQPASRCVDFCLINQSFRP